MDTTIDYKEIHIYELDNQKVLNKLVVTLGKRNRKYNKVMISSDSAGVQLHILGYIDEDTKNLYLHTLDGKVVNIFDLIVLEVNTDMYQLVKFESFLQFSHNHRLSNENIVNYRLDITDVNSNKYEFPI